MVILSCIYTAKYFVSASAPPVEGGAFVVLDGQIVAVGSLAEVRRSYPAVKVIDYPDAILTPLLVNAHTHLELTDYPDWNRHTAGESPTSFVDWILHLIEIKRTLDETDYRLSLRHGIEQSMAAGTGAVGDILSQYGLRDLYTQAPLNGFAFLETLGQDPEKIGKISHRLHQALDDDSCGSVPLGVSPHSPYTISRDYLTRIYSWCRNNGSRCTTHLAESAEEVQFVEKSCGDLAGRFYPYVGWEGYIPPPSGLRPVEYLAHAGGLFPENLLVHGVQLNDAEIATLAEKNMSLVLCLRSNAQLDVGHAPAGKLQRAGVKLALGTDSLSSCDSLSIWDEMAFAHRWFDGELDAPTLFRMATLGGAEVLGLESRIGSLEIGKSASFQVLRPKTTVAVAELFDYFISPTCTDDIVQVYHQGKLQG